MLSPLQVQQIWEQNLARFREDLAYYTKEKNEHRAELARSQIELAEGLLEGMAIDRGELPVEDP